MAQLVERSSTNPKVVGANSLQSKLSDFDYSPLPGVILISDIISDGGLLGIELLKLDIF